MPRRPALPPENRRAAERLAARGAKLTDTIDTLIRKKETAARTRDEVWYEASLLGMAHTDLARTAGVHHSQVDRGVLAHAALVEEEAV